MEHGWAAAGDRDGDLISPLLDWGEGASFPYIDGISHIAILLYPICYIL